MNPNGGPNPDKFRILCVDGGGIRGLISALVIARIEGLLRERDGEGARISQYFHLLAGTSTGGLITLALTRPEAPSADQLAGFYTEDGPDIFDRSLAWKLRSGLGTLAPKYSGEALDKAVRNRLKDWRLADATRDLVVTAYDMTNRKPFFFKRWKAQESEAENFPIATAALSTAAAPTYFPSQTVDGRALVDGGVFAANPTIAAIAEALGRERDPPAQPTLEEMLVVSIGTGEFSEGFPPGDVHDWGMLDWIRPRGGNEPPILSAMLGGSSDGTDYWAHMLLNHAPGKGRPKADEIGRGKRYYRFQVRLASAIEMDDASPATLGKLQQLAEELIAERDGEIKEIVARL